MKTIEEFVQRCIGPEGFRRDVMELLQRVDPRFPEEYAMYQTAADALQEAGGKGAEYLSKTEEVFHAAVPYMGWQGFSRSMAALRDPVRGALPEEDLSVLCREEEWEEITAVSKAREQLRELHRELLQAGELSEPLDAVAGYYAYLETWAYKLAHYLGFRMAQWMLQPLMPECGFADRNARRYRCALEAYLQIDLQPMG